MQHTGLGLGSVTAHIWFCAQQLHLTVLRSTPDVAATKQVLEFSLLPRLLANSGLDKQGQKHCGATCAAKKHESGVTTPYHSRTS